MRASWTIAVSISMVLAGVAAAGPVLPPDQQRAIRPRLDDFRITPAIPPAPNCGDVVPLLGAGVAPPPPGALPGSSSSYYFTPGYIHIQAAAMVRNIGTQPAGGTEAYQFVTVTQRPTGSPETELLRARFRPLNAGATQRFPFAMRLPFDTTNYRAVTPGTLTVTVSLSFDKRAPVTLRPADCVLTDNVLVRDLRFW